MEEETKRCKHTDTIPYSEGLKSCLKCGAIYKAKPEGKLNCKIVLAGIVAGKKKKDIAAEAGSLAQSDRNKCSAVTRVQKTQEYKREAKKYTDKLQDEIERLVESVADSSLDGVMYKDKVTSLERLTKLKELLTGGATDRTVITKEDVKKFLDKA